MVTVTNRPTDDQVGGIFRQSGDKIVSCVCVISCLPQRGIMIWRVWGVHGYANMNGSLLDWLYAIVSEEHTASIFRAEVCNIVMNTNYGPLEQWNIGFEFRSDHRCRLCPRFCVLCCPVQAEVRRRDGPTRRPSSPTKCLNGFMVLESILNRNRPFGLRRIQILKQLIV
jgi:ferredoxin